MSLTTVEWLIDASELMIDYQHILGVGQYTTIYKGRWRCLDVAIKQFTPAIECPPCGQGRHHLEQEIQVLTKMHHPYVVQLLGVCLEPFCFILEYMKKGDVRTFLLESTWQPRWMTFLRKRDWSIQLCTALLYLHERKPEQVIHRDVKPSNLLLHADGRVKLSDFGIARLVDYGIGGIGSTKEDVSFPVSPTMTTRIGTPYFMAPELLTTTSSIPYNHKVDVWSLGSTLFEIWEQRLLASVVSTDDFYTGNWRIPFHHTPTILRPILQMCWSLDPQYRPDVRTVLDILGQCRGCWW